MKKEKIFTLFHTWSTRKKVIIIILKIYIYIYIKAKAKPSTKTKQNNRSTTIKASVISTTETRTISQCHHVFAECFH